MRKITKVIFMALTLSANSLFAGQPRLGPTGLHITGERTGSLFNPIMSRVYVQKVDKDSCAERSGFERGDEIISINEKIVTGQRARELMDFWKNLDRSQGVPFLIKRNDLSHRLVLCAPSTRSP